MLKIRFKDIGLHKVEAREFSLEDSKSKRSLQLARPWTVIMRPGLHISMSMVFRLEERQTARCPGCGEENAGSDLEDIEWYKYYYNLEKMNADENRSGNTTCGITYRKIVEKPGSEPQLQGSTQANPSTNHEMQHYTRLHIVTQATVNGRRRGRRNPVVIHQSSEEDGEESSSQSEANREHIRRTRSLSRTRYQLEKEKIRLRELRQERARVMRERVERIEREEREARERAERAAFNLERRREWEEQRE